MQMRIQCDNKVEQTSTFGMLFPRHIIFRCDDYPLLLPGAYSLLYSSNEILSYLDEALPCGSLCSSRNHNPHFSFAC